MIDKGRLACAASDRRWTPSLLKIINLKTHSATTYLIFGLYLLLLMNFTTTPARCDNTKSLFFSSNTETHLKRRAIDNATSDANRTNQPLINASQFCGEPPTIANGQSNLKRNQKHYVWSLGTKASYMCDQGYRPVGGVTETSCTLVPAEPMENHRSSSYVIFPDRLLPAARVDVGVSAVGHHLVSLGSSSSRRYKNSKRLFAVDADEESEPNANSAAATVAGVNRFGALDKRKSSRKSDDDLIAYETDDLVGRHGGGENDYISNTSGGKRNRAEKGDETTTTARVAVHWWPPVTLDCQVVNCPEPGHVENANRREPPGAVFGFNSNVQYECLPGFEAVGIPFMTCRANGQWNRPPPKCRPVQCPTLPQLENGRIFYANPERIVESKAEYLCDSGYKLNAVTIARVCRPDGQWASLEPLIGGLVPIEVNASNLEPYRCLPVMCQLPVRPHAALRIVPLNTKLKKSKLFKPGESILFICYTRKLRFSAKCRSDGEWARDPPDCPPPKECPPLNTTLANGNITLKSIGLVKFGCDTGYDLRGAASLSCLSSGEWSASVPICVVNSSLASSEKIQGEISTADDEDDGLSLLTILITAGAIVTLLIFLLCAFFYRRWRQNLMQRKRWQQYFGRYNTRQSRMNMLDRVEGGAARMSADATAAGGFVMASVGKSVRVATPTANGGVGKKLGPIATAGLLQSSSFSSADESGVETIKSEGKGHTYTTYAETIVDEEEDEDERSEGSEYFESLSATSPVPPPSLPPPALAARTKPTSLPVYTNVQGRDKVIPVTDL